MKFSRSAVAAFAMAVTLVAASPAFAVTAVCTAKDSTGKRWKDTQTGIFDWQVKTIAGALAKADCQGKSKRPRTCQIVGCKITSK